MALNLKRQEGCVEEICQELPGMNRFFEERFPLRQYRFQLFLVRHQHHQRHPIVLQDLQKEKDIEKNNNVCVEKI